MTTRDSKPNNTGRASGKQAGRAKSAMQVPKDVPWIPLTRDLLESAAWRGMSINCRKLIDFLIVDHMNHAGQENGNLKAPYDQLVTFGLTRSRIASAVHEAEYLRLIRVERGGRWAGSNRPSTYELTFLHKQRPTPTPPANDWKKTTEQEVAKFQKPARQKNRIPSSQSDTAVVRKVELPSADSRGGNSEKPQKSANARSSQSGTASISTPPISNGAA